MPRRVRPRSRWRRSRRNRRTAAALLLATGALAVWIDLSDASSPPPGVAVAYAARAISSGSVIDPADVGTAQVDRDSPLGGAGLPPDAVLGRTAVGDLAAGEMVTANRITDGSVRPGFAAMPVSFAADDLTQFLTAGSRIDIVWSPGEFSDRPAEVIVRNARVLRVAPASKSTGSPTGASVLLEVAEADAVRLAAAMDSGSLSVLGR